MWMKNKLKKYYKNCFQHIDKNLYFSYSENTFAGVVELVDTLA